MRNCVCLATKLSAVCVLRNKLLFQFVPQREMFKHSENLFSYMYVCTSDNIFYFRMQFIPVMQAEFSASLQSSVSHDPSEINMLDCCSRNISEYYQC